VSPEVVALWCEFPAATSDVEIAIGGVASELLFKRRVITRGRRLHLFVFRTTDVKTSEPCSVAYRPEKDKPVVRSQAAPSLAEWTVSSVTPALHAIVEGLAESGGADTRLLARFLTLTCSWGAPCRYHGSGEGLSVGVFDLVPSSHEMMTALVVADGSVTIQRLVSIALDDNSCCLIWRGAPFERAYLQLNRELVELKLETRGGTKPLPNWFAALAPEQQDAVLDGIGLIPIDGPQNSLLSFGRHLRLHRDFGGGAERTSVLSLFALGSRLCAVVEDGGGEDNAVQVSSLGHGDRVYDMRPPSRTGARPGRAVFSTTAELDLDTAEGRPFRLTIGRPDNGISHWLPVQAIANPFARRRIRNLIDWESADEDFVREFASASIGVEAAPREVRLSEIALSKGASLSDAALLICRYNSDLRGLRATLIAVRLSAGDEIEIRLVSHVRPSSQEILDLRALCQYLKFTVGLVIIDEEAPFGDALKAYSAERRSRVTILADSGIVPVDRDWWQRLSGLVYQDPTLLAYGQVEGEASIEPSALTYMSGSTPLIVAGPRLAPGLLDPAFDLHTFEGVVHHAVAMAGSNGKAERLDGLRLLTTGSAGKTTAVGAARLDDAMVAAALAAKSIGVAQGGGNLVRLAAPRSAGAG